MKDIGETFAKICEDLNYLIGTGYESHVATYLPRYIRRELNIEAAVFSTRRNKLPLLALMDEAEKSGRVSQEETDLLNNTGIVLEVARNCGYIPGEISITVQQEDIERAVERAAILAKATGVSVMALAVGQTEQEGLNGGSAKVLLMQQYQDG